MGEGTTSSVSGKSFHKKYKEPTGGVPSIRKSDCQEGGANAGGRGLTRTAEGEASSAEKKVLFKNGMVGKTLLCHGIFNLANKKNKEEEKREGKGQRDERKRGRNLKETLARG